MKNVLKTILLTLHTQIIINLFVFIFIQLGIKVFVFNEHNLVNSVLFALSLIPPYFLFSLCLGLLKPKLLSLPFKEWSLLILLIGLYTLSFILSQSDFNQWRIYFIGHMPVAYMLRSWLPSDFDFTQQFLIGLSALTPALGLKFGYEISTWLNRRYKKSRRLA